jgi:hypothetical protein
MNGTDVIQTQAPALPAHGTVVAKRCYQCKGHFGLIRHRFGLKQFCSTRCLTAHKAEIERTKTRLKEWAHFLSR